jgi:gliding motility-associated-like protein
VSPDVTTEFTISVTDNCLNQTTSYTTTVNVPLFDPLQVFAQPDLITQCPFTEHTFVAEGVDGAGDYAFLWNNHQGFSMGSGPTLTVSPGSSTFYTVTVLDFCGNSAIDTVHYTITSPPLYPFVRIDTLICLGDSVMLEASATGGFGNKTYFWPHSQETTSDIWVQPSETTTYTVVIADDCLTFTVNSSATIEVTRVIADFTYYSETFFEGLPVTFENQSQNATQYEWTASTGYQTNNTNFQYIFNPFGLYDVTLYAENDIGCWDTITKSIKIRPEHFIYVPNTFTPDGNRMNDFFSASTVNIAKLEVFVFNRWGENIFYSNKLDFQWDGTYNDAPVPNGLFVYKIFYTTLEGEDGEILGHVNVLR